MFTARRGAAELGVGDFGSTRHRSLPTFSVAARHSSTCGFLAALRRRGYPGERAGFSVALEPTNLLFCFTGVFVGTFIGVLPGLGPIAAIALLLPLTFKMAPATAIIMLAGILLWRDVRRLHHVHSGQHSGRGGVRSYLSRWLSDGAPGAPARLWESRSRLLHCRNYRTRGLMFFAGSRRSRAALRAAGFCADVSRPHFDFLSLPRLDAQSTPHGYLRTFARHWSQYGSDLRQERFTYGSLTLGDGLGLVPVTWCVRCCRGAGQLGKKLRGDVYEKDIADRCLAERTGRRASAHCQRLHRRFFHWHPSRTERRYVPHLPPMRWKASLAPSRKFGNGAIEGVAGPESANNSATAGAFIPLLSLGFRLTSSWLFSWERS